MSMTMTKWQLFGLLSNPGTAQMVLPDGRTGILQSVLRESSCGKSFVGTFLVLGNVLVGRMVRMEPLEVNIRTTD